MIIGFKEYTKKLTAKEKTALPLIRDLLVNTKGAITNNAIRERIRPIINLTPWRIRKIIHHIRVKQLEYPVIANSKGYYIAKSKEDVRDYIKSLKGRIASIKDVLECFEEV